MYIHKLYIYIYINATYCILYLSVDETEGIRYIEVSRATWVLVGGVKSTTSYRTEELS